jgi:hypothetical protein
LLLLWHYLPLPDTLLMERYTPYLLVLLLLLLLIGVAMVFVRRRQAAQGQGAGRGRKGQSDDLDTVAAWEPTATRIMTGPEREAFHTLRAALPEHMILAQVQLARFIKVPTRNSYSEWMRRAGNQCADLVICDATSQVVAVVEIRQPFERHKERAHKRYARMDRVLEAAKIPVHVWLDNALPGPAVARETILGAAVVFTTKSGATLVDTSARAMAPPLPTSPDLQGLAVHETPLPLDFDLDQPAEAAPLPVPETHEEDDGEVSRRMSTWFESAQSGGMPLDPTPRR